MNEVAVLLLLFVLMIGMPLFVALCPLSGCTMLVLMALSSLVYWWPLVGIIVVSIIALWRFWMSMPSSEELWIADKERPRSRLLVVLGSGGHTTEMFYDLASVEDWRDKFDAAYIIAETDNNSLATANAFENDVYGRDAKVFTIPRPREVGQSFSSSIVPTLRAILAMMRVILVVWPDAVICNGPGTCVPAVIAAYLPRIFWWKRIAVMYSESLACVSHLSLSGSILFQFADVFTVQWDPLYQHCSQQRSKDGHLLHAGRCRDGERLEKLPLEAQEGDGTAIVTVGSTKFEDLIRAIDSEPFITALAGLGIKRLKVQKGNGTYEPTVVVGEAAREAGIEAEVITYSPSLPEELRCASLIISHAGAGTVLDCLNNRRRLLIVPNEVLMDNHQVQLCEELARYSLVRWSRSADIVATLDGYSGTELRKFPENPTPMFASALRHICGRPDEEEIKERKRRSQSRYDSYGYDSYGYDRD